MFRCKIVLTSPLKGWQWGKKLKQDCVQAGDEWARLTRLHRATDRDGIPLVNEMATTYTTWNKRLERIKKVSICLLK